MERRADIWAFGCVLYEMLAGHRAFDGKTVTDVLGAIIHKEPDLGWLPAQVPQRIRQLVLQCLQKDGLTPASPARVLERYLVKPRRWGQNAGELRSV